MPKFVDPDRWIYSDFVQLNFIIWKSIFNWNSINCKQIVPEAISSNDINNFSSNLLNINYSFSITIIKLSINFSFHFRNSILQRVNHVSKIIKNISDEFLLLNVNFIIKVINLIIDLVSFDFKNRDVIFLFFDLDFYFSTLCFHLPSDLFFKNNYFILNISYLYLVCFQTCFLLRNLSNYIRSSIFSIFKLIL